MTPFRGAAPHSILIGPVVLAESAVTSLEAADARRLGLLAEAPLRSRGYRVPRSSDALLDLAALGWIEDLSAEAGPSVEALQEIGRAVHVDAVLTLVVREWEVLWSRDLEGVRHDFEYVLWSTATGEALWRQQSAGSYQRADEGDWGGTLAERGPALTPVEGMGGTQFDHPDEAARAVHRWVLARLPERG